MEKIRFVIYGKVQGIGYRWFVLETATRYLICGWVKNNPDGTVEGIARGDRESINKFMDEIRTKHPLAKVDKIEISNYEGDFPEVFTIKH